MSDTFFGFESDLPELDGKLVGADEYDYPVLDDEIDLVNDETFGDDIADDWEEEHERLNKQHDSMLKEPTSEQYKGQELELEHNISQLVEDGDDNTEPPGMTVSKSRQIPGRNHVNLDELFGPSSPPAFLDTEHLVSPGKLDIWGSPTRPQVVKNSPAENSGQKLLRMLQTSKTQVHSTPTSHPMPTGLPQAPSVEAIEQDLKQMLINKPQGLPMEDLERHLRGPSSPQPPPGMGMPLQRMPQLPHGMHTVMGRGSMNDRRSPPQFLPNASLPMHMMPNRFGTPPPAMYSNQMRFRGMMSPAGAQRIPMHSSQTDPRDMRRPAPMYQRPHAPMRPSQFNNNHDHRPPHHYHPNNHHHHHHQQDRNYWQEPPGGNQRPRDEYAGLMTQKEKDWVIKIQLIQLHTDNPYIDDYYYTTYCMRKLAKENHSRGDQPGNGDTEPKLLLPAIAKVETKAYTPVRFEGSLGKLTASSVHKPRQILDVGRNNSVSEEEDKTGTKDSRRIRKLLMEIEKVYDVLLQIDDIEKKVLSMPEDGREPLFLERKNSIKNVFTQLYTQPNTNEQFVQIACVRKGLKLIGRALQLLDKIQAVSVISAILRNFAVVAKKDQQNNILVSMLDTVLKIIKSCDFPSIVQFSQDLMHNGGHKAALQNKFGVSVIFQLVNVAESLSQVENITGESADIWSQFLQTIAETVVALPEKNLAHSSQPCSNVVKQFETAIGGKLLDSFEQRVVIMTSDTTPS